MLYPLEQIKDQISKTDQQLMYHMITQQMETNRLLTQLIANNATTETAEAVNIESLKRPDLMKHMSKLKAPQGWNKWNNEKMINFLKGVS